MTVKDTGKRRIVKYIQQNGATSKTGLCERLALSMPTVINQVNTMLKEGILVETGKLDSNGGRKAISIDLNPDYCYSAGLSITSGHISLILMDFAGRVISKYRCRLKFSVEFAYYVRLSELVTDFIDQSGAKGRMPGIGVALPGIIDREQTTLMRSHALGLTNYSLGMFRHALPLPVCFENDANAAMLAEHAAEDRDYIYLSLNNTLGGAMQLRGSLFYGDKRQAGEFGHMILKPGGKRCYCGKEGCADAYCSAAVLTGHEERISDFMGRVKSKDPEAVQKWEQYLDDLSLLISNLRMAYDTDIILGGDVGGVLAEYMQPLGERVMRYNLFDQDLQFLKTCSCKEEMSATGAARLFLLKATDSM